MTPLEAGALARELWDSGRWTVDALTRLLNGELGRLDAGVFHQCLRSLMTAAGLDADQVSL